MLNVVGDIFSKNGFKCCFNYNFMKKNTSNFVYISELHMKSLEIPKGQNQEQQDKQLSTTHTHKTNDQVTQTPSKTGGELRCSGRAEVCKSWIL